MSPEPKARLLQRAQALGECRQFFAERQVTEVDTPLMSFSAPIDLHLEPVQAQCLDRPAFFHTSPEYAMKRLLAAGSGDIYQIGHVFRDGEMGRLHRPEFTMIEWYRLGFSFEQMIRETCELVQLFVGEQSVELLSYREAFQRHCNLDPFINPPHDDILNERLALEIEPHLGKNQLTVLHSYPANQAALARIRQEGDAAVAERFEVYYQGVELANGYHELANSEEQRARLEQANGQREAAGKAVLPIDEKFVACLDKLPDCCGVAAGFDRLLMLRIGSCELGDVLPFTSACCI